MRDYTKRQDLSAGVSSKAVEYDEGLRAYMMKVYNHMAVGLVITGALAMGVASSEAMINAIYGTPLRWLVMLAPFGFVIYFNVRIKSMSENSAKMCFYTFAALMGVSLSYILLVYTGESIARVFFVTASVFGAMSLYGYTTKKDLTGLGSFLIMGLFGIIIAGVVNIFMQSTMMHFAISVIGVLIFVGLTAYDTQKIKNTYYTVGQEMIGKAAIMGALSLYLDFINLMIMLLRLFGDRR